MTFIRVSVTWGVTQKKEEVGQKEEKARRKEEAPRKEEEAPQETTKDMVLRWIQNEGQS
jgi:hypothetical protein